MSTLALILVMAACLYAVRLSGFALATATIPPRVERTLGYVPIATLTALVVASLAARDTHLTHGIVAAAFAVVIARLTRRAWACIAGGMLIYWLLRLVA
ncbi:MAG: AzlD domain-containing protein [Vicinamibacterales bacterium]